MTDRLTAVITGATGMIGTALARICVEQGIKVFALVNPFSSRSSNLPISDNITVVPVSIDEISKVDTRSFGKCDLFFHLAWVGSKPSDRGALYSQVKNIEYSLDAVELAERLGCSVFVGAGSQAEYGRQQGKLQGETPTFPENGYGIAKLAAGQMTRLACSEKSIRHEWARILSIYGPGDGMHTMVMSVIADAEAGRNPACTKGEQMWDYMYCDDCARALLAMALYGKDGAIYPVGSGSQTQLREFISAICNAVNKEVKPDFGAVPYYENQVMNLCADISQLVSDTGFNPSISFEDGISRTIDWYRRTCGS